MEKTDTLKFSLATPKEITRAFLRIWHPANGVAPTSARILQDVKKVLTSVEAIVGAKGKIVPGLVNLNGHRRKAGTKSTQMGTYVKSGKKTCLVEMGIHESIHGYVLDLYRTEKKGILARLNPTMWKIARIIPMKKILGQLTEVPTIFKPFQNKK